MTEEHITITKRLFQPLLGSVMSNRTTQDNGDLNKIEVYFCVTLRSHEVQGWHGRTWYQSSFCLVLLPVAFICNDSYGSKWLLELQLLGSFSSHYKGQEREKEKNVPSAFRDSSWKLNNPLQPLSYRPEVSCLTQMIARKVGNKVIWRGGCQGEGGYMIK